MKVLHQFSISAASGLVKYQNKFYVVSDDENNLIELDQGKENLYQIFTDYLPEDHVERKLKKADLESLCISGNTLYGFPSGSTENRVKGFSYDLVNKMMKTIDHSSLYKNLNAHFSELNIEGSIFVDDEFWLFQRGNGSTAENGIIILDRNFNFKNCHKIELGFLNTIPLGFTDACYFNGEVYFLAVAENTSSTYDDGKFEGAVLGKLSLKKQILNQRTLPSLYKPEGLWVEGEKIYFVTDADDRNIPSELIQTTL